MWDLPGPGLNPVSPALAGGFLTTAPPGKSLGFVLTEKQRKVVNCLLSVQGALLADSSAIVCSAWERRQGGGKLPS